MSDLKALNDAFGILRDSAAAYFKSIDEAIQNGGGELFFDASPDAYWKYLSDEQKDKSSSLQRELLRLVSLLSTHIKRSPLASAADENDLKRTAKEMRAALQLRSYRSWDTEILNDEDVVLGVRPAGQSNDQRASPAEAARAFERGFDGLGQLYELAAAVPAAPQVDTASGASAKYRPNTVFVMMAIDPKNGMLEDVYEAIKSTCTQFGLVATRADQIEHEEVITDRILTEIRTSEFLIADLTNERPSVYYEIGYAHALGKRVILYRHAGTRIHFDLAAYNCPEYRNITDLREKLVRRFEDATNRRGGAT